MKEKIALIVGLLVIIGTCFSVYFALQKQLTPIYVHTALAEEVKQTKEDVKQVKKDLDVYKKDNYLKSIQQRIWTIKERHGEVPKEKTIKEELNKLEVEKKETEEYIKEKSK
jgi:hypothetical protein